jgi:hypothetical protein
MECNFVRKGTYESAILSAIPITYFTILARGSVVHTISNPWSQTSAAYLVSIEGKGENK